MRQMPTKRKNIRFVPVNQTAEKATVLLLLKLRLAIYPGRNKEITKVI